MEVDKPINETQRGISQRLVIPHIRCLSCGKITGKLQEQYNSILARKKDHYRDEITRVFYKLVDSGVDEDEALTQAKREAKLYADLKFNQEIKEKLAIERTCCYRTLFSPIVRPTGGGVDLSQEVDVGTRASDQRWAQPESGKLARLYIAR